LLASSPAGCSLVTTVEYTEIEAAR
jgi:hypothetical protein